MKVKFVLFAAAIAWIVPAHAHLWYPKECCNDKDCHEADNVTEMPDGSAQVRVGGDTMSVPRRLKRRKSLDEHYHVCYGKVNGAISVYCFFQPGLS